MTDPSFDPDHDSQCVATTLSAPSAAGAPTVTDVSDRRRFEIAVDGAVLGFVNYRRRPGFISLVHTEINPGHKGEGLGTLLVKATLDAARAEGLAVLPYCPFVQGFIDRHREYLDLVPADRRAKFALDGGSRPPRPGHRAEHPSGAGRLNPAHEGRVDAWSDRTKFPRIL